MDHRYPVDSRKALPNGPHFSCQSDGYTQTVCPSLEEATHPRCWGEGSPDWPGRASSKEGESWVIITARSLESIRRSCAMPLRSRRRVVAGAVALSRGELPPPAGS